jgi:hypothetical protein
MCCYSVQSEYFHPRHTLYLTRGILLSSGRIVIFYLYITHYISLHIKTLMHRRLQLQTTSDWMQPILQQANSARTEDTSSFTRNFNAELENTLHLCLEDLTTSLSRRTHLCLEELATYTSRRTHYIYSVTVTRYCSYSCFVLLKMGDSETRNM